MKITQVMLAKGFGGMERYFVDLCLELAHRGHAVQAICHSAFSAKALLANQPNIQLETVRARGNWDLLARRQVFRQIKAFQPQLIESHLSRATVFASNPASRLGIPLVSKTHNYLKLKYYRQVDHFVAATRDQQQYLLANHIPASRITVIPNFSTWTPVVDAKSSHNRCPLFVAYGRFVQKKGFDTLLAAFQRYLQSGQEGRLILGGDGPEKETLLAQCAELGLKDQVAFPGWIDDTGELLSQADVFVLPSLDEPFGIVVLEAMARGIPIISTRTQGPAEILSEHTARLVPPGDTEALHSAMAYAATHPAEMHALATSALDEYRENYHADVVIPRIIDLYSRLAAGAATA